ncbi:MAG: MBL fold metallo-hydrolase [Eubacteriales bacterium]
MEIINVGNRVNNNYIIKLEKGYLLIDTGYPEQFNVFRKKLRDHNIGLKDISYILLTHSHDDHAGFLNELLDYTEAKVILHHLAVDRLRKGQNSFDGGCTGYLALTFYRFMKLFGKGEHKFPPVDRPERYIVLDDSTKSIIEEQLSGTIINLPGHTIDSIGFLLEDGSLFCGDAAMNGFPSLNRISIWIEDLKDYKESWKVILNKNPSKIYPSHGKPFIKEDLKKNLNKINNLKYIL